MQPNTTNQAESTQADVAEPTPSTPGTSIATTAIICLIVCSVLILLYDLKVRSRVPKLAVVDIGEIYVANQSAAFKKVLSERIQPGATGGSDPAAIGRAAGMAMAEQLKEFSAQCDCLLIASPAVYGRIDAVPDYTDVIKKRYGLTTSVQDVQQLIGGTQGGLTPSVPGATSAPAKIGAN